MNIDFTNCKIKAICSFDFRGNPAFEISLTTEENITCKSIAFIPYDTLKISKLNPVEITEFINEVIPKELKEFSIPEFADSDKKLSELYKKNPEIPPSVFMAVSTVQAKCLSKKLGMSLFKFLGGCLKKSMPTPVFVLPENISGKNQSKENGEFYIVPEFSDSIKNHFKMFTEIKNKFYELSSELPHKNFEGRAELALKAVECSGYEIGYDASLGICPGASSCEKDEDYYIFPDLKTKLSKRELISFWASFVEKYGIKFLEDGVDKNDIEAIRHEMYVLRGKTHLVFDRIYRKSDYEDFYNNLIKLCPANFSNLSELKDNVTKCQLLGYKTILCPGDSSADISWMDIGVSLNFDYIKLPGNEDILWLAMKRLDEIQNNM